uniref:Uncharacterized protein n=1 Tax=Araucaria cunninghamii TaxID=56994 RepID=A0A0D6R6L9_ARACU
MRFCLQDSALIGNISVGQPSMAHEWIGTTPKLNHKSSPVSTLSPQEAGSESLPHITWSPECDDNNKYQLSDVSVQSFSHGNVSFKGQEFCNGTFPEIGNSSHGTSSFDKFPFFRSTNSLQAYPCYSHQFLAPGVSSGPAISGHSSSNNFSDVQYKLEELEASFIRPDNVGVCNVEALCEDRSLPGKSECGLGYTKRMKRKGTRLGMENQLYPSRSVLVDLKQVHASQIPQDDIEQLLIACAEAVDNYELAKAEESIALLRQRVSVWGNPIQRLGAYMVEGLEARLRSTGTRIYKRLKCKEPDSTEVISYFQILKAACPCFRLGYVAANGAIAEALKDKDRIHIVDFHVAEGNQWETLIQALGGRKVSPPSLRITGIEDPESEYVRDGRLQLVGKRLSKLAESCNVPFEFHALALLGSDIQANMLEVRDGEALAVNFAFQLHRMPDESVSTINHRDRLLQMVRRLDPHVVTLVEQESNTNTAPFFPRFKETLNYYSAVFESLDVSLPRDSKDRVNIEENCLACNIVNIIACEDAERVVRHEVLGKWRARLTMAGFRPYPLNSHVTLTIKTICARYCDKYKLIEKDEAIYLGWLDRLLVAVSAWH